VIESGTLHLKQGNSGMKKRYLSDNEISEMAAAAETCYEWTSSWKQAFHAAKEFAQDELQVSPNKSAVALAVNLAKLAWEKNVISTKKIIEGENNVK
jgi:hypothetical protein